MYVFLMSKDSSCKNFINSTVFFQFYMKAALRENGGLFLVGCFVWFELAYILQTTF